MKKTFTPFVLLSAMAMSSIIHAQEIQPIDGETINDGETVNTGSQSGPVMTSEVGIFFIAVNGLRVRSTPEDTGKTMGLLSLNEKVRVVGPVINGKYVQIEILKTVNPMQKAEKYFVAREYLSAKEIDYKEFTGKYFVVVNVATETLRLYERQCLDNSCPNKMIMETEVVVGEDRDHPKEDKGKGRSVLGSYRVTGWAKFYQDSEAHYPAWYKEGYPELPESYPLAI